MKKSKKGAPIFKDCKDGCGRKGGFQTFGIYLCQKHRHRRHIVIVSLKQQVENDDTNDGIPTIFENAVQTLILNSLSAIFTSYPELSPAGWD